MTKKFTNQSPDWYTSTYSAAQNECVEVASLTGSAVGVRDSKDTARPHLALTSRAFASFVEALKDGTL